MCEGAVPSAPRTPLTSSPVRHGGKQAARGRLLPPGGRARPSDHLPPGGACGSKMADGEDRAHRPRNPPAAATSNTRGLVSATGNGLCQRARWWEAREKWPQQHEQLQKLSRAGKVPALAQCVTAARAVGHGHGPKTKGQGRTWQQGRGGSPAGPCAQEGSATQPCFLCPCFLHPQVWENHKLQQLPLQGSTPSLARKTGQ